MGTTLNHSPSNRVKSSKGRTEAVGTMPVEQELEEQSFQKRGEVLATERSKVESNLLEL